MRKLISLILISYCCVASAQTAKDFFNRASKKYKDKEYAAAAVEYTRALELSPESAVLFNNRGLCYFKLEQWDKALNDYERAIILDPNYKQAYLNAGNVSLDKTEYDKALLSFDKALAIDSFYTPVYAKKAFSLYQLEDYKGALVYYDKAIEYAPVERANLFNARGATYEKLGKAEMALADYDKTLEMTPSAYETFINRGILKTKMQRYESAIQDFTVAQSFAGMSGEGYYYRGLCRVGQLDAIRGTKEKHYVMDIKKNNKLLELACSDFDKAKSFSYGRAFEAHQEYCVEKKGEDPIAIKSTKQDTVAIKSETTTSISKVEKIEAPEPIQVEAVETNTLLAYSPDERNRLKNEIKAEIIAELLAEYELVPRIKDVLSDTNVIEEKELVQDSFEVISGNILSQFEAYENWTDTSFIDSASYTDSTQWMWRCYQQDSLKLLNNYRLEYELETSTKYYLIDDELLLQVSAEIEDSIDNCPSVLIYKEGRVINSEICCCSDNILPEGLREKNELEIIEKVLENLK